MFGKLECSELSVTKFESSELLVTQFESSELSITEFECSKLFVTKVTKVQESELFERVYKGSRVWTVCNGVWKFGTVYNGVSVSRTVCNRICEFRTVYNEVSVSRTVCNRICEFRTVYNRIREFGTVYNRVPEFKTGCDRVWLEWARTKLRILLFKGESLSCLEARVSHWLGRESCPVWRREFCTG